MQHAVFTIPDLLNHAEAFGDRIAVTEDNREITFADLIGRAKACASGLRSLGVARGDRVGVCMAKGIDQTEAIAGILAAGAVLVPILPRLKPDNVRHIVHDSAITAVIIDDARRHELLGLSRPTWTIDQIAGHATEFSDPSPATIGADLAAILYSSGSTGRAKGIMVTHRNFCDGARIVVDYLGITFEDRIAGLLSFNFDYGLNQLWQVLLTGASLHLHELLFPRDALGMLERRRITVLPVMPVVISRLFDRRLLRSAETIQLPTIRLVCTSGGPVSDAMIARITHTFFQADLYLMYGLTEAFRSTYLPPELVKTRPRSIGRAIPDVEILVLDLDGNETAPHETGELVHRGGCVSRGYWNDPAATAARFRTLEKFCGEVLVFSGDLVTRDEEGYLYFVGRRDAMIKTSGFRVSPTEVEEVATRFAGVEACVAVGVPDDALGEVIELVYTASDRVSPEAFRAHLRRHLPDYMVPTRLTQADDFPMTGNQGKINRPEVSRALLRDRGHDIGD